MTAPATQANRPQAYLPPRPLWVFGLDLGQMADYTALTVIEAHGTPIEVLPDDDEEVLPAMFGGGAHYLGDERGWVNTDTDIYYQPPAKMTLRWLERFELHTSYVKIARAVKARLAKIGGVDRILALDATGVGRGVVDIFWEEGLTETINVTITGGSNVSIDGREVHVPKKDLIHGLLVAMQNGRFVIGQRIPYAGEMAKELGKFRMNERKVNAMEDVWRSEAHDDLVLSTSISAWVAEQEILAMFQSQVAEAQMSLIERQIRTHISPV